jgi:hypothetical protein
VVGGHLNELRGHELLLELACHLSIHNELHEKAAAHDEHEQDRVGRVDNRPA